MRHFQDKRVLCPFYHQEKPSVLMCEGVEDGCSIQITFDSGQHKADYKDALCCEDWEQCRVSKMLNEKYA